MLGFMIAQEYYDIPIGQPLCRLLGCIPVKHDGRDLTAMRIALLALEQGRVLPIFPEGRITPKSGLEIKARGNPARHSSPSMRGCRWCRPTSAAPPPTDDVFHRP